MNLKRIAACLLLVFSVSGIASASPDFLQNNAHKSILEARKIYFSDLIKVGENIEVSKSTKVKSAVTFNGDILVKGEVIEDVVALFGSVRLGQTARVHGNVVAIGGTVHSIDGARVAGEIKEVPMPNSLIVLTAYTSKIGPTVLYIASLFASLMAFLGVLAIGAAVGLLFPRRVGWTASAIENNPVRVFLWGLLWAVLALPISFVLVVSIIGIPLLIGQYLVYGIAIVLGYISFTQILGKKLLASFKRYNQPIVTEIIWGIAMLALIGLVPVLGAVINIFICVMALGAAWVSRFGEGI